MPDSFFVKKYTRTIESAFKTDTFVAKKTLFTTTAYDDVITIVSHNQIPTITVYDSPVRYVEPFIYIDGGAFDQEGTPVDALFYDTLSWDTTWDGRYV